MAASRIEFDPNAAGELFEARAWYGAQSTAAARNFADEFSAALDRIQHSPDR